MRNFVQLVARVLFPIARLRIIGRLVGIFFEFGNFVLPVKRLVDNDRVIAFYHPKPTFPHHVLIVPKKRIPTFMELISDQGIPYLGSILMAARDIIKGKRWGMAWVLGVNGGPRQDVEQVHFHLYKGQGSHRNYSDPLPPDPLFSDGGWCFFFHPDPDWDTHLLVCITQDAGFTSGDSGRIRSIRNVWAKVDKVYSLTERGYTVFVQSGKSPDGCGWTFHVLSGEALRPQVKPE